MGGDLTIPGENLNLLRGTDLVASGEISDEIPSPFVATVGGGGGGSAVEGWMRGGLGLGLGSRIEGAGEEEDEAAAWEWRSKKCWMPNLEGWEGWLFAFLKAEEEEEEDDDEERFLGAMGARD